MNNFELAYQFCAKHEFNAVRHYTNLAEDPGGSTNWGITQRAYDTFKHRYPGFPSDVKDLSEDQAKACDKGEYWPTWASIQDDRLAAKLYDMGYNIGIGTAVKYLQDAVGVPVDGHMGPLTLASANQEDPEATIKTLCAHLVRHYMAWVGQDPTDRTQFQSGLLARAQSEPPTETS